MSSYRHQSALLRLYDPAGMIRYGRRRSGGQTEVVVTAHGWLSSDRSMRKLSSQLQAFGYQTIHWTYPSLRGSIVEHAGSLSLLLRDLANHQDISRIHLVTHSMGGIIARVAIQSSEIETQHAVKCGRMVMLAPPNHGSKLTRLPMGPLARWFPQLSELTESADSLVNQLSAPEQFEFAVIAAAHDFVVSVDATHLSGQTRHNVVATSHQRLVRHPQAIELTLKFLRGLENDADLRAA